MTKGDFRVIQGLLACQGLVFSNGWMLWVGLMRDCVGLEGLQISSSVGCCC